jgi:hypothetical protein
VPSGRRTSTPASCSAWLALAGRRCPRANDSRLARAHVNRADLDLQGRNDEERARRYDRLRDAPSGLERDCNEWQTAGTRRPAGRNGKPGKAGRRRTGHHIVRLHRAGSVVHWPPPAEESNATRDGGTNPFRTEFTCRRRRILAHHRQTKKQESLASHRDGRAPRGQALQPRIPDRI